MKNFIYPKIGLYGLFFTLSLLTVQLVSAQLGAPIPSNNALHFVGGNGTNLSVYDYISIPDNGTLDLQGTYTIETWIYLDDASNNAIIDKGNYGYLFQTHPNGQTGLGLYNASVGWIYSAGTIPVNVWAHVAVTFDNPNNRVVFYLNGNVLSTHTGATFPAPNNDNVTIGMQAPGYCSCNNFNGKMDEFRIWNRALCQAEIQANMNCELNPVGQTGLLALYHFNQGTANGTNTITSVTDASGNNNNGTLTNFALSGTTSNWVTGLTLSPCSVYVPPTTVSSDITTSVTVQSTGTNFTNNCSVISRIVPSGASPVSGTISCAVKFNPSVQTFNGQPYLQRHYDIEPATNPATSTATLTLYFTQTEFNNYNAARGTLPALPTSGTDFVGIGNFLITQFHGTGTAPGNYTGSYELINPTDANIVWNGTAARWEVTFNVTGFSGFYVHTSNSFSTLPVNLLSISGRNNGAANLLQWTTSAEESNAYFNIERSMDGVQFSKAGSTPSHGNSSSNRTYVFNDNITGINSQVFYYRLKMVDQSGTFKYSSVVKIKLNSHQFMASASPNPFTGSVNVMVETTEEGSTEIQILDVQGRRIQQKKVLLQKGNNVVMFNQLENLSPGIYMMKLTTGLETKTIKIIKQ